MPTATAPNAKLLFAGLLALCGLSAVLLVMKLFTLLLTVAIAALVIVGLYEGFRVVTLVRGLRPPPSSLGLVRGVGQVALIGMRTVPAVARWVGSMAHIVSHSTQEIATGSVLGGLVGLVAGWHYDMTFTAALLGVSAGAALGFFVGRRRLRLAARRPVRGTAQRR
jgi:hypothetical protein